MSINEEIQTTVDYNLMFLFCGITIFDIFGPQGVWTFRHFSPAQFESLGKYKQLLYTL
jgi:hypothetical protein